MKKCPNCSMELPEQAYFCPRCMYQFEKREVKQKKYCKKYVYTGIIIIVLMFISIKCISAVRERRALIEERNKPLSDLELQAIIDKHFKLGKDIPYNPDVKHDLRNYLTMDFETFREIIGKETKEMEMVGDMAYYTYDTAGFYVNSKGLIQGIVVAYETGENTEGYGIYGITAKMNTEDVQDFLGEPTQDYGDRLYYGVDDMYNPGLNIYFGDDGAVEMVELYYLTL